MLSGRQEWFVQGIASGAHTCSVCGGIFGSCEHTGADFSPPPQEDGRYVRVDSGDGSVWLSTEADVPALAEWVQRQFPERVVTADDPVHVVHLPHAGAVYFTATQLRRIVACMPDLSREQGVKDAPALSEATLPEAWSD